MHACNHGHRAQSYPHWHACNHGHRAQSCPHWHGCNHGHRAQSCPHLIGFVGRQPNARQQRRGRVSVLICVVAPRGGREGAVVSTCMQSRSSVAISGNQWQSVAISGNQWQSVAISGNQRTCIVAPRAIHRARQAISGNQWQSVAISGNQWQSTYLHRCAQGNPSCPTG